MDLKSVSAGLFVATIAAEAACLFFLFRSNNQKKYPALTVYLLIASLFDLTLGFLPWLPASVDGQARYHVYFWALWWRNLLLGVMLVFILQQLFREIMAPLPGLSRLGVLAGRWVIAVTIIVSITSSHFPNTAISGLVASTAVEFLRCVSVLCISLLISVTVIAKKVGLSDRSRPFGIAVGLGISALAYSVFSRTHEGAFIRLGTAVEAGQLITCCVWAYYLFRPEVARVPIALPPSSTLLRWNRISLAFGHPVEEAPPTPSQEFFLTEVERVVDKVLTENPLPDNSLRNTGSC